MRIIDYDDGNSRSLDDFDFDDVESTSYKRKRRRDPHEWWEDVVVPRRFRKASRRRHRRRGRTDNAA